MAGCPVQLASWVKGAFKRFGVQCADRPSGPTTGSRFYFLTTRYSCNRNILLAIMFIVAYPPSVEHS